MWANSQKPSIRKKVGFIVNPLAGIGGRVGLKGSDGEDIVAKAFCLGAVCEAPAKAKKALERLLELKNDIDLITWPGPMSLDRKSTRLNSSHSQQSRMPSSA